MNFLFNYSFEIALGTFLIMWLTYRRNGTWQNAITAQYQDKKIIQKRYKDVFRAVIGTLNYCDFAIQKKKLSRRIYNSSDIVDDEIIWRTYNHQNEGKYPRDPCCLPL
jgi:hypothetical protein